MRRVFLLIPFLGLAMISMSWSAQAAPQILGLTAFNQPLPFTCTDGTCSVELTTFCLQKRRDDPEPGTAYSVHDPDTVRLSVIAADGSRREMAADGLLELRAHRSFTAVRVSLGDETLKALGGVRAEISVAGGASLVPVPVAGDPDPISPGELAHVTGPLRKLAGRILEGDGAKPTAIRLVNRVLNATPLIGRMQTAERHSIWKRVIGETWPQDMNAGTRRAVDMLGACQYRVDVGRYYSLRGCLSVKQDSLMLDMNLRYWSAVDLGS